MPPTTPPVPQRKYSDIFYSCTAIPVPPVASVLPSGGVCPKHGNTLISTGGKTCCRVIECGRTWSYDRVGLPCIEPAQWRVTDKHGDALVTCDGHALDARKRLEGARVELREELA
jgi:hypothetical protein